MCQPKYEGSDETEISSLPFVSAAFLDRLTIRSSGAAGRDDRYAETFLKNTKQCGQLTSVQCDPKQGRCGAPI